MKKAVQKARLTSAELSQLWTGYMQDSLLICVLKHFLHTVEDKDMKLILQHALKISQAHLPKITTLFESDNRTVPHGFTDQDVDLNAPRLFSDQFMLSNLMNTAQLGLQMYAQAKALCARRDVRKYFSESLRESDDLYDQTVDLLLSKGIYVRSPVIDTPDQVDYVSKQNFFSGWIGKQRPLLSLEIANLFANTQRNAIGMHLITGFNQVARSKEVQQYFKQGKEVASKQVQTFTSKLQENNLPASMLSDEPVTNSTVPPFSDKLMLFQVTAMNAVGIAYYGTSVSTTFRHDLAALYPRLVTEIAKYTKDGANILVENGWMEEPPRMIDHDQLAKGE